MKTSLFPYQYEHKCWNASKMQNFYKPLHVADKFKEQKVKKNSDSCVIASRNLKTNGICSEFFKLQSYSI